jgi:hypothetical protein
MPWKGHVKIPMLTRRKEANSVRVGLQNFGGNPRLKFPPGLIPLMLIAALTNRAGLPNLTRGRALPGLMADHTPF